MSGSGGSARLIKRAKASSLLGMTQANCGKERFYDTLMPDVVDYINRCGWNVKSSLATGETDPELPDCQNYDYRGDPFGIHIANIFDPVIDAVTTVDPAEYTSLLPTVPAIRARVNGWTGGQLQEWASLGSGWPLCGSGSGPRANASLADAQIDFHFRMILLHLESYRRDLKFR